MSWSLEIPASAYCKPLATRLNAIMTGHYELERIYFPLALLPYGAIGEPNTHCTHLQIAQASP